MEGIEAFLEEIRKRGTAEGHLRGLLHILVGRKISRADGSLVSGGMTWRAVADFVRTFALVAGGSRRARSRPRHIASARPPKILVCGDLGRPN